MILVKPITFFGKPAVLACDGNCRKAWGANRRPSVQLSDDENDFEWLADHELGEAPARPGSWEGADTKPRDHDDPTRQNKWCARECERSVLVEVGPVVLPDFSARYPNLESRRPPMPETTEPDPRGLPVTDLHLGKRARDRLARMGVATVGELLGVELEHLMGGKGFGITSLHEVAREVRSLGLTMRADPDAVSKARILRMLAAKDRGMALAADHPPPGPRESEPDDE